MSNSRYYNPCDHLTCYTHWKNNSISKGGATATVLPNNGGVLLEWDMPSNLFSQERGNLCTVEVESSHFVQDGSNIYGTTYILWADQSTNATSLGDFAHKMPVLYMHGAVFKNNNSFLSFPTNRPGPQIMTAARPNKVRIVVTGYDTDGAAVALPTEFGLSIIFKFTYYDAEAMVQSQKNQIEYKTL